MIIFYFNSFASMHTTIKEQADKSTFVICSGSVSMGDKDFLKPVLKELGFKIHFGRVNVKPGFVAILDQFLRIEFIVFYYI